MKKIIGLVFLMAVGAMAQKLVMPPGIQVVGDATNNNVMVYQDGSLIDAGVAPTNLVVVSNQLSVAEGDTRYAPIYAATNSGAFIVTATNRVHYDTFSAAYSAATEGQSVVLSAGIFDVGDTEFTFSKSVNVVGAGSGPTTILANGFNWSTSATNCSLTGVQLTQEAGDTGDCLMFSGTSADVLNVKLSDVYIWQKGTSSDHCFEVTGSNIELDNVRTRADNGHAFVMKGVSNLVVRNCESKLGASAINEGFLIKADAAGKGNCYDILMDGFKSNAKGFIQPASNGAFIKNVSLYNISLDINAGSSDNYAIECGFGAAGLSGHYIENLYIDGLVASHADNLFIVTLLSGITNMVLKNAVLYDALGNGGFSVSSSVASRNTMFENVEAYQSDGWIQRVDINGDEIYSTKIDEISNGILAANVSAAYQTTTGIWVVATNSFEPMESRLAVGDPVLLDGGDHDGVYRLEEFGTSTTDDFPITGAVSNDYYIRITDNTTTANEAVDAGDVWMGKLIGRISPNNSARFSAVGTVEASGFYTGGGTSTPLPSFSRCDYAVSIAPGGNEYIEVSESGIAGVYAAIKAHVFIYDSDSAYAGIFVAGPSNASYAPNDVEYPRATIRKTSSYGGYYGFYETKVLP